MACCLQKDRKSFFFPFPALIALYYAVFVLKEEQSALQYLRC